MLLNFLLLLGQILNTGIGVDTGGLQNLGSTGGADAVDIGQSNFDQAVRISDQTAFFLLGDLVEYGNTEQMFSQPKDQRTEDYITGRFG